MAKIDCILFFLGKIISYFPQSWCPKSNFMLEKRFLVYVGVVLTDIEQNLRNNAPLNSITVSKKIQVLDSLKNLNVNVLFVMKVHSATPSQSGYRSAFHEESGQQSFSFTCHYIGQVCFKILLAKDWHSKQLPLLCRSISLYRTSQFYTLHISHFHIFLSLIENSTCIHFTFHFTFPIFAFHFFLSLYTSLHISHFTFSLTLWNIYSIVLARNMSFTNYNLTFVCFVLHRLPFQQKII